MANWSGDLRSVSSSRCAPVARRLQASFGHNRLPTAQLRARRLSPRGIQPRSPTRRPPALVNNAPALTPIAAPIVFRITSSFTTTPGRKRAAAWKGVAWQAVVACETVAAAWRPTPTACLTVSQTVDRSSIRRIRLPVPSCSIPITAVRVRTTSSCRSKRFLSRARPSTSDDAARRSRIGRPRNRATRRRWCEGSAPGPLALRDPAPRRSRRSGPESSPSRFAI